MESTVHRPAVDLTARRSCPGLALLLGLLSLPGSTVAWDLPAGGLWIGLPLGAAAIVVGLRARRELAGSAGSGMALAGIVLGALAVGSMVAFTLVSLVS